MDITKESLQQAITNRDATRIAEALLSFDPAMQLQAIEALKNLDNPAAIPYLVSALKIFGEDIRNAAFQALVSKGESAVKSLIRIVQTPVISHVPETVLGDEILSEDEELLTTGITGVIKARVVEILGEIGDRSAVPALAQALGNKDEDYSVRVFAASSLGKIGDAEAVTVLIYCLNWKDIFINDNVIQSLGQIGDTQAVLPMMVALAKDRGIDYYGLYFVLKEMGAAAAEELVLLLNEDDVDIRARTCEMLGELRYKPAGERLISLMQDDAARVRREAVKALGKIAPPAVINDPVVVPVLMQLLKDELLETRIAVIELLGTIGDDEAVEPLLDECANPEPEIRIAAIRALGRLGNKRAADRLPQYLDDVDWEVRKTLVAALELLGHEKAAIYRKNLEEDLEEL
ncbi:MAG: hypothetical protein GY754_06110 [bacterium]|nr:hypothetical protein [bacterium]